MQRLIRLMPHNVPIPLGLLSDLVYGWGNGDGNWSAQPEYLMTILRYVAQTDGLILECGSGLSTVLLGLAADRKGNKVWSLEHSRHWAEKVRASLKSYRINSVEVCVADLRNYGPYSWYDLPKDRMPSEFSLVVCDGPPGDTHGGRYGLLPIMRSYLRPGCVILLDDAQREAERTILSRWADELGTSFSISEHDKTSKFNGQFAILSVPIAT